MTLTSSMILVFLCAFAAFSLSAVCGGGAGLLLMPILGLVAPVNQVPAILSIGTASSSISRTVAFFSQVQWKVVRWFVPAALPAVFMGAWLLQYVNPKYLEFLMGAFLVSNLSYFFKKSVAEIARPSSHANLLIVGFFAGFLSGLTGAVGLLFNRFYLRYGLSKEEIVATRAVNEGGLHLFKLILYAQFGLLSSKVITLGLLVAMASVISAWFMKWGLRRISESFFKRVGYLSMVASGIMMIVQAGTALALQNNASFSFLPIANGLESKIQWQQANLAIEFQYNEGFEYEQQIAIHEVPLEIREKMLRHQGSAAKIVVEEVFSLRGHSYEAYYFKDGVLIEKMDFS
jgi:uncharacterized membrane protein YfcA